MSPLDVARRMLRANCDPGLIVAYLALELELDPTLGMTAEQRMVYTFRQLRRHLGSALGVYAAAFESVARALSRSSEALQRDYQLAGPGAGR